jgi:hypothetical protein
MLCLAFVLLASGALNAQAASLPALVQSPAPIADLPSESAADTGLEEDPPAAPDTASSEDTDPATQLASSQGNERPQLPNIPLFRYNSHGSTMLQLVPATPSDAASALSSSHPRRNPTPFTFRRPIARFTATSTTSSLRGSLAHYALAPQITAPIGPPLPPGGPPFTQCSPSGYNCNILITFTKQGALQIDTDPNLPFYPPNIEGAGSLIGFQNNSNGPVHSLSFNAAPGVPYEAQWLCSVNMGGPTTYFNAPNVSIINIPAGATVSTPPYYFYNFWIGGVPNYPIGKTCDAVFTGGVPKAGSTYFSLHNVAANYPYFQVTTKLLIPRLTFQDAVAKDQTAIATLTLYPANTVSVTLDISTTAGSGGAVFAANNSTSITLSVTGSAQIPIKGVTPSSTANNIQLRATVSGTQRVTNFTVIKSDKIPLGSYTLLSKFTIGKVYAPTEGQLKLTGGTVELFYTNGTDITPNTTVDIYTGALDVNRVATGSPITYDLPPNKYGWYYVKMSTESSTLIMSTFTQNGTAAVTPWNGWYWPRKNSIPPNLYGQAALGSAFSPLEKYDAVYNTTERSREEANFGGSTAPYWHGHCWGWAAAAMAMAQPAGTTKNGIAFNQDEMEGLYSELAAFGTFQPGLTWVAGDPSPTGSIPATPVTEATDEQVDFWPDDFHNALVQYIRRGRVALISDLRARPGDTTSDEVWNHDVYWYESTMAEASGGNEKVIEVTTMIRSNTDGPAMPPDGSYRQDTYVYVLEYNPNGTINGSSPFQNWTSVPKFAPACFGTLQPEGFIWGPAAHCTITKANVDGLYQP